ncbi:hypothetical protein NVP1187O_113 [Vibrio phage 1.187.O._10N.286.49.F1]|nr:hypothetical protein NVP1187O_113 [Vibrio phage 1.187.O._10N.286.49.F1]
MVLTKQQVKQILEFMENETALSSQVVTIGQKMFVNNMETGSEYKEKNITDVSNW